MHCINDTIIQNILIQRLYHMKTVRVVQNEAKAKNILRNAQLMSDFLAMGYKTRQTFIEIFKVYYPEVEVKQIYHLWNIRSVDAVLLDKFESILNRLRQV